ncbi:hypothetical protein HBB89_004822 [Salmonella enterica]|uniref:Uncharacterized protein n=1 Tax=Salmonella enterica TaxID=28901 RepID=A0A742Y4M2_SALER|nr:hypothetical protein [Salmonella enterica subsp. enterica serovar Vitkin]EBI4066400.1 hypothetical protein [Salmonella enterica]EBQ9603223.1 hypothetical protein [Salmonella enterica subsp. enterica serovar Carmel]EBV3373773.1 hypothetical protein [Salmonella enterica subsp. enterica serovar Senftenberg]EBV7054380.1 hypothetical protein [Salmonella enterica subsp. enterica serovar Oranienburg]EBW7194054.1 hypothetical protein [Salmonella enterica subsp. enterica serovar Muenster]EBY4089435
MAAPSKPPKKNSKGVPPSIEQPQVFDPTDTPARTKSGGAQMSFNVDPEFKREFKTVASSMDMSLKDVLTKSFELFKAQYNRS